MISPEQDKEYQRILKSIEDIKAKHANIFSQPKPQAKPQLTEEERSKAILYHKNKINEIKENLLKHEQERPKQSIIDYNPNYTKPRKIIPWKVRQMRCKHVYFPEIRRRSGGYGLRCRNCHHWK